MLGNHTAVGEAETLLCSLAVHPQQTRIIRAHADDTKGCNLLPHISSNGYFVILYNIK